MKAPSLKSLEEAIVVQQIALHEADRRLTGRMTSIKLHIGQYRSAARNIGLVVLALGGARLARRSSIRASIDVIRPVNRLSALLHAVLPLLLPVIGARVAALISALAAAPDLRARPPDGI